jgi:hypothetical protein
MSHTTLTVPDMNEPPRRHDITIRVAASAAGTNLGTASTGNTRAKGEQAHGRPVS